MKGLNFDKLKKIVEHFSNKKVLVIGDLILDEFVWGKVFRISPEAPVPVVLVDKESFMPGGAANVANNIASLGAQVYLAGVTGNDEKGAVLKSELDRKGINTDGIILDPSRPTTLKTRVVAHHQQVVRIDRELVEPIKEKVVSKCIDFVKSIINKIDAVIIEDYAKGVIVPELLKNVIKIAKKHNKIISVDPKEEHFNCYKGVTVITPNITEASRASGVKIVDDSSLEKAGNILIKKLGAKITLITLGEEGMAVFQHNKPYKKIPTVAQEVYDVSGAGDTAISSYTLSLASGATPIQAAHIANCAAGIVVGKVGIAVVTQEELIKRMRLEILEK